jgi:hypothetical protein
MPRHQHLGLALAAAAVTAFAGWLLEALIGHAHKVAPFIVWSVLRGRGIATTRAGRPLGFADLYNHYLAAAVYALLTVAIGALCAGFGSSLPGAIAAGGMLLIAAAVMVAANLSITPLRMLRRAGAAQAGSNGPPRAGGGTPRAGRVLRWAGRMRWCPGSPIPKPASPCASSSASMLCFY